MIKFINENKIEMEPLEAIELAKTLLDNAHAILSRNTTSHHFILPIIDMDPKDNTAVYPSKFTFVIMEKYHVNRI